MIYPEPIPPSHEATWLEPSERVLWRGKPLVDRRFRLRLWTRAAVIVAALAIVGPLVLGAILGAGVVFTVVGAIVITTGISLYVPALLRKLTQTEYFVTSRRAVVVDGRDPDHPRVTWAPLNVAKIKVKKRRDGSTDLNWGRCGGRITDRQRPAEQVAQALGLVDRPDQENVVFVEIDRPAPLLGAIRGGRAALGLAPGFE